MTAIGQNLSAEQWYGGLLAQMAQQLGLEDELEEFWDSHAGLGPLQRWMQAVRRVVLPGYPVHVVVFIDEIDAESSRARSFPTELVASQVASPPFFPFTSSERFRPERRHLAPNFPS